MDEKVAEKAREIISWVESACTDAAYDEAKFYKEGGEAFSDEGTKYFVAFEKRNGPADQYTLGESYSEHLYNDPSTLQDLMGDRICDACNDLGVKNWTSDEYPAMFNRVLDALEEHGQNFPAWNKAIAALRKDNSDN